ncbi:CSLREA domain-containing protein [Conexibacter sp. W3-3-2]|uniref:CSLREA domain-containing protein n=1 Tax=Conexibacter sp. W3-3-2 TaxID=2675227 RepID=UPI0012B90C06|nr:CSLREA domain-containing protein [Conexibacter sp. W3-3-2]MTD44083.1 CSLREA domain-containing protein [Conexibacter sp. W3-3-2]
MRGIAVVLCLSGALVVPSMALGNTYTVTTTGDAPADVGCQSPPGDCTLREAITAANDHAGPDQVNFEPVAVGVGTVVFTFLSELPAIADATWINGYSADPEFDEIAVELVGGGAGYPGLRVTGSGAQVQGVSIHGFSEGIVISGDGVELDNSRIGIRPDRVASQDAPGNGGVGVRVASGATGTRIGGVDGYDGNVVSGNAGHGVLVEQGAIDTILQFNRIGTSVAGQLPRPNDGAGIRVEGADTLVGGSGTNNVDANFVAANAGPGVDIGPTATGTVVRGSYIGLADDGSTALPNLGDGIRAGAPSTIGGLGLREHNTISGNAAAGIRLTAPGSQVLGNRIGVDELVTVARGNAGGGIVADDTETTLGNHRVEGGIVVANGTAGIVLRSTGTTVRDVHVGLLRDGTPMGNAGPGVRVTRGPVEIGGAVDGQGATIAHNAGAGIAVAPSAFGVAARLTSTFQNGGLGVDLDENGVTADDGPGDADAGANGRQNAPVLESVSVAAGQMAYSGTLASTATTTFGLEFSRSTSCDPSGRGEGAEIIGRGLVTTDADGRARFTAKAPTGLAVGDVLTATATAPDGSTSEYSACRAVTGPTDLRAGLRTRGTPEVGRQLSLVGQAVNAGTVTATDVVLELTPPPGTELLAVSPGCAGPIDGAVLCSIPALAAGETAERTAVVALRRAGSASAVAAVRAAELDAAVDDDRATLEVLVTPPPEGATPGATTAIDGPQPRFASSVVVARVRGTVEIVLPDGTTAPIDGPTIVPVGTTVDAAGASSRLTTAQPDGGLDVADFHSGRYRVTQRRVDDGVTTVRLTAALSCPPAPKARAAAKSKAKKKRRSRGLWGKGEGRFRTQGRYADATVRGTHWLVRDTCTSSTVTVRQGVVRARPLNRARGSAATLRAGASAVFTRRR